MSLLFYKDDAVSAGKFVEVELNKASFEHDTFYVYIDYTEKGLVKIPIICERHYQVLLQIKRGDFQDAKTLAIRELHRYMGEIAGSYQQGKVSGTWKLIAINSIILACLD